MKRTLILSLIVAITFCWSQANKIRKCQASNCQVCSSLGVCVMCLPGHILSINKQTMVSQCVQEKCNVKNCSRCVNQNICALCQTGFTLNLESKCIKDNLLKSEVQNTEIFCKSKSSKGDCIECLEGLQLIEGKCLPRFTEFQQVTCQITNCTNCLTSNFCSACQAPLVPSSDGSTCITNCNSTINNCLLCSSSLSCATCMNGYTLSSSGLCILCSITGCQSCNINGVCLSCYQQYTLNSTSNQCQFTGCQYPCSACNSTSPPIQCTTCFAPYNPTPLQNGTCFTCSVPNCAICSSNLMNACTNCSDGYNLSNGSCVSQLSQCAQANLYLCTFCIGTTCGGCVQGYTLLANGSCIPCVNSPVCLSCNSNNTSVCTQCMAGYYLNSTTGSCLPCIEISCDTCSSSSSNPGQCQQYQSTTGYLTYQFTDGSVQQYVCDVGCQSCSPNFPMQCLQCMPGFYIQVNSTSSIAQCLPCATPCMTCSPGNSSFCLTCYSNSALTPDNNCTVCNLTSNCLTCSTSNATICTSCPPGFGLLNNVCLACPINCQTCFNSSGTGLAGIQNNVACTSCNPGFGLSVAGYCLPCLYNCRVCSGAFQQICLSCSSNFYLNATGFCTPCSLGCTSCVPTGCLECAATYLLVANNGPSYCTPMCPFPCSSCSLTNSTQCTTCLLGYTLLPNNTCAVSLNTQLTAPYCGFGSYLSGNQCLKCNNNCSRCSAPSTCISCFYGFYYNATNNSCLACPTGCSVCSNPTSCVSCQGNYTLINLQALSNQPYCSQCALPCLQCTQNPQQCLSCIPGFTFIGFNCISNLYYYFAINLQASQQTFYDNYQPFMAQLQYALSTQNLKSVVVTSITQTVNNSVNYTFVQMGLSSIIANNSQFATYEYNNLQFSLMNQDTFGNMPVVDNILQLINGPPLIQSSSVPMICGIVIPIGVVILTGILYCIFSRNNMDLPGSNYVVLESSAPTRMTELRPIE